MGDTDNDRRGGYGVGHALRCVPLDYGTPMRLGERMFAPTIQLRAVAYWARGDHFVYHPTLLFRANRFRLAGLVAGVLLFIGLILGMAFMTMITEM